MVWLLPCKPLNGRTVRMYTEHICFHSFLHQVINLIVTLIITVKTSIPLPCTGNRISIHIAKFCMFIQSFHPKVTSRKISEFHTERFPDIILSDDIGNTVVDQDPVFRHLIHITVFIQFFCYVKTQFRSFFAFYIKL